MSTAQQSIQLCCVPEIVFRVACILLGAHMCARALKCIRARVCACVCVCVCVCVNVRAFSSVVLSVCDPGLGFRVEGFSHLEPL